MGEAVSALTTDAQTAAGMLEECGLEVTALDDDATRDVFHQILNKRTSRYLTLEEPNKGTATYHLAPNSVNTTHRLYIEVDGVYHSTLYITGYGYPTQVYAGWLGVIFYEKRGERGHDFAR